jgi:muramoyltetrapeptide carboxypeptidase
MNIAPRKLRRGSKIALVAPSFAPITTEIVEGIDIMHEMGLVPVLGPCVKNLCSSGFHAGSVADRAAELNWAFSDPDIAGVFAVRGGAGAAAVLPHLDYRAIRNSRKVFLGMSDNTALNTGILSKSGLITFNGQSVSIHIDRGTSHYEADCASFKSTLQLLMSPDNWGEKPFEFNRQFPRTVSSGNASGVAVGGNLDTFVHLIGTPYIPELSSKILFVEDVHKTPIVLGREFLHLQLAGILKQVNGVVLGEFSEIPKCNSEEPLLEDVINEYFSSGVPCTYGYPFSHGPFTGPIPIGAMCYMNADMGNVEFDFVMSS